jgi:uncharacterized SAM-binding protein YcdF (DUF218 family)
VKDLTWRRAVVWSAVLSVGLLVIYVLVTFVQVWWASNRDGVRAADAVVVLGAAQYDGRPSPVLKERLDHAFEMYDDDLVGKIVVTGGSQEGDRFTEAQAGAMYLQERGVPDENLIREVQGTNTWETLAASAWILREQNLTDVVFVTDGYHALRVDAIADELGLNASVSPSRKGGSVGEMLKETAAVAVGRIVGFRRMVDLDGRVGVRDG